MNMALDEALLEHADDHSAILRIYQWSQPTLSLGYFQRAADRQLHPASSDCDLVRRPSGGGAILHDRELTYCLVLPEALASSQPHAHWYYAVHLALIAALGRLTGGAGPFSLCSKSSETAAGEKPFLCFARRAVGDVLCGEHKIAGSAQRRRSGAILQHGSVLLARSPYAPELAGIGDLIGGAIKFKSLASMLADEIADSLALSLRHDSLTEGEVLAAQMLHNDRYVTTAWTHRR
jgi:lipoate-protein ligase A